MSATYTAGGVDPVSRLRAAVRDTSTSSPIFPDEDYYAWLERCLSPQYVAIYHPGGTGITSAPVRVLVSGASLVLQLQRVGVDVAAQSITLAPSDRPMVEDLVDGVAALAHDWRLGLGDARGIEWLDLTATPWSRPGRPTLKVLAEHARRADLALHRQGTLAALGDENTFAKLRFYEYSGALALALDAVEGLLGANAPFTSRRDGNSAWTRGELAARRKDVHAQVAHGIYGRAA